MRKKEIERKRIKKNKKESEIERHKDDDDDRSVYSSHVDRVLAIPHSSFVLPVERERKLIIAQSSFA